MFLSEHNFYYTSSDGVLCLYYFQLDALYTLCTLICMYTSIHNVVVVAGLPSLLTAFTIVSCHKLYFIGRQINLVDCCQHQVMLNHDLYVLFGTSVTRFLLFMYFLYP